MADLPNSPVVPKSVPDLPAIKGVTLATVAAGVRYKRRDDVMLACLAPGTAIAGVFTRSATRAAPVLDCQAKLGGPCDGSAVILVNAGNANAFTGRYGQSSVAAITAAVATATGVDADRVFTASTGVIGEPLPEDRIVSRIHDLVNKQNPDGFAAAARAIMTTDTYAKMATEQVTVDNATVTINGIAKGSGMIAPDMATLLVYIFTDAQIVQDRLQSLVYRLNDRTFNCITVDSDTSTSDSLLVCATGASGISVDENAEFETALYQVMLNLAHQVVRDGEGATKFVEIRVTGAASNADAKIHGLAIANSPLVKTAIAGEDPNWGRIVMAIGKSGAAVDRDRLTIHFGDILVAERGWVSPKYEEAQAVEYMKAEDLVISVDLGLRTGAATVWTCDLTHGYIDINADYRS
ncbi:MAG: bifunctional glutamate N-acetyltransferase/amino-acid acetyltransferase ArgJ [Rhodobacteraceae bacterium]|nr:bifunctional glutamate N-acetyltransferase/amino-acid acetyltransferase ArgJ [Paracoccaceae bacterium]